MTIYENLAVHFLRLGHIESLSTGQVTIGRTTYPAARYIERLSTPQGTPAYARGQRHYTREMIYCVGMLPVAAARGNVVFTRLDGAEWYVAGYYGKLANRRQEIAEPSEFQPFGNTFMLAPWDVQGSKIDDFARVPYRRQPLTLGQNWVVRRSAP